MPQLSLYVDDKTMSALRDRAAMRGTTLSKYVVRLIRDDATSKWPEGYWGLFGALRDESFVAPAELPFSLDAKRGGF